MKAGDLVEAMRAKDMLIRRGIIIKQVKPAHTQFLDVFEVMTSDGEIMTYSTAALRVINESR